MYMTVRTLSAAALVLSTLVGCAAALPHANQADAARVREQFPSTNVAQLEHGRSLYVERCAGCHQLREPASETPAAWPGRVTDMREAHGVHLSDDEQRTIVAYLVSISSR